MFSYYYPSDKSPIFSMISSNVNNSVISTCVVNLIPGYPILSSPEKSLSPTNSVENVTYSSSFFNSSFLRQTAGSAAVERPTPENSVPNAVSRNQLQQVRGSVAAEQRIPENSARNAAIQDQQMENGSAAAEQKTPESSVPNVASQEDNPIPMKEDSL